MSPGDTVSSRGAPRPDVGTQLAGGVAYSVVIPVYRSEPMLPELHRRLSDVLRARGESYEIVFVDDASPDGSWRVIGELAAADPHVRGIQLMHNAGQPRATLCGLAEARGRVVATMDDDLQQFPEDLPLLLDALASGSGLDAVIGAYGEKQHRGYRNFGSRVMYRVHRRAFGLPEGMRTSSFRAMRAGVARAVVSHATFNPVLSALVFSSTSRVANVPVRHAPRAHGRSGYSIGRQVSLAFDAICSHTMLPLRAMSAMGALSCALAFVYALIVVERYLTGRIGVPGWTTVVLLLLVFMGLTMLGLGIIGEYLVRIIREVSGAPRFIIRERTGGATAGTAAPRE
jgi:dolichol-phosphate mannosyltransferase/undecaprenyl-phosphate 4-deoxy-4-formamido-L-arabinose transferase